MTLHDEAIARFHKILQGDPYRDLTWVKELHTQMEAERLSAGGRLLCPFLRPHFLFRRQYDAMVKASETLLSAVHRMREMVLTQPMLLSRLDLLPAEKMLAAIDPRYPATDVTSRLDWQLTNGPSHLEGHLVGYAADSPTGIAWSDSLAELFLHAAPVKEFRKKYKLVKTGGKKPLLAALLSTYKQFKGPSADWTRPKKPNIAILEFRPAGLSAAPSEYELFAEFFRGEGCQVDLVSPDQLEFRNGVLRRGPFEIHLLYRRISAQEFLQRFDLNHPLVQAYKAGAVCVVNSFRSELAHKKAFFALLSDETLTAKFPAAERHAIDAHIPWTRVVTPAGSKTTRKNKRGKFETIDLHDFILKNRDKLVLKPNDVYSSQGSYFGWEMDDAAWARALRSTARSTYVAQDRVEEARGMFPLESYGHLEYKDVRIDVHPQAYLGKVNGCSSWLSAGNSGGYTSAAGLGATLVIEGGK